MKKKMTVLFGLLMAVAVTGYSVGGTYAKYISQVDVTDQARVAKWDFSLANKAGAEITTGATIDLFKTSYEYDTITHKYVESSDRVVAPGTGGEYTFNIKGNTETNYTLAVKIKDFADSTKTDSSNTVVSGSYDPIRFRINKGATKGDWVDFANLETALNKAFMLADGTTRKVYGPSATVNEEVTIEWVWAFDETDAVAKGLCTSGACTAVTNNTLDTKLGEEIVASADSHKVILNIEVTAEQTQAATN